MEVRVNAAMSADGKLSTIRREQIPISGPADFDRVDSLRAEADAVMVGIGTVLADDPHLTVKDADLIATREDRGESGQPARIVTDSRARTPIEANILVGNGPTFVLVSEAAPPERVNALESVATVIETPGDRVDLDSGLDQLEAEGIDSCLVEGGGELVFSLLEANLVDELTVYVGDIVIGGRDAPTLVDGDGFVDGFPSLTLEAVERLDTGVLLSWTVSGSDRSPRRT
jgi:2,5-diamino-6-(ribosylamino)-4(3H)-pyrimidinone 5'-phosphate reductase